MLVDPRDCALAVCPPLCIYICVNRVDGRVSPVVFSCHAMHRSNLFNHICVYIVVICVHTQRAYMCTAQHVLRASRLHTYLYINEKQKKKQYA